MQAATIGKESGTMCMEAFTTPGAAHKAGQSNRNDQQYDPGRKSDRDPESLISCIEGNHH